MEVIRYPRVGCQVGSGGLGEELIGAGHQAGGVAALPAQLPRHHLHRALHHRAGARVAPVGVGVCRVGSWRGGEGLAVGPEASVARSFLSGCPTSVTLTNRSVSSSRPSSEVGRWRGTCWRRPFSIVLFPNGA